MKPDTIKICDLFTYRGRNIYSHRPVMKLVVDIGSCCAIPTKDIDGFNEKLLNAFPGLKSNCCGLGYAGGFFDKLNEGTYLAHVLEHVVLEMQFMLGYDVRYGKTRLKCAPSVYYLVYEYENEVCGLECGKAAVFILNCFISGKAVETGELLEYLKKVSVEAELGPSTTAIVAEAKKRGMPCTRIGSESLVRLGYGRHSRIIESTLTDATSCIAADISCNKHLTKAILSDHHIPIPYGKVVYSEISAVIAARQIGFPVVLKPFDGNQGKGVFLDLSSDEDVKRAFKEASGFSTGILVEKYISGRDFRVLVVGDKVSAVSERLPAMVTGDGARTVKELVDDVNRDQRRGESHEKPLTKIKLDCVASAMLEKNGLSADSVPEKGRAVRLRANGNLSTGGTAVDYTDIIHPENAELAVLAARAIGIDIAGIDFVTPDISRSILENDGAIVEVNTAPGIRMHIYPSAGKPRDVAKDIVDHLFPREECCAFPIVSVTGTNGKTTTVRLIAHTLSISGKTVGFTSTSGTFIGQKCLYKGDHSGPRSAGTLLSDKTIDCAVLETARGGILREGLGYDLADVGMVLNIADDHLGADGTETLEDLAYVKSLVTEAVKKDGYAVFNGDDALTPYLMKRTKARVILFSKSAPSDESVGGPGIIRVYAEDGWITVKNGRIRLRVTRVDDIPITRSGRIACNVENALAAVSALYALGLPSKTIADGLRSFRDNAGRFNLYSLGNFKVMLDYGHNLPGYAQVVDACKGMGFRRLTGVIGMPGDRGDDAVRAVGKYCSGAFGRIYIKEDKDRRGRRKNEVARLFYDEITACGFDRSRVEIVLDELDALKKAVAKAQEGELIVVFYEKLEPLREYLESAGAKADDNIEGQSAETAAEKPRFSRGGK